MDYSGQNMDMVTFVLFYTLVMSQWWMKTQKNVTTLVILWPVDGQYLLDRLSMIPQKVHDNGMYLWSKSVATAPILFLGRKCETCHCCKYQNPTFNISISLYARQATIIYASKRQHKNWSFDQCVILTIILVFRKISRNWRSQLIKNVFFLFSNFSLLVPLQLKK